MGSIEWPGSPCTWDSTARVDVRSGHCIEYSSDTTMAPLRFILVLSVSITSVLTFPSATQRPRAGHLITSQAPKYRTHEKTSVHHFKKTIFGSLLLVPANMDILDQTKIFTKLDPFHEQFIPAPAVNAGSLPLSSNFG